jgi:hypothetical protein
MFMKRIITRCILFLFAGKLAGQQIPSDGPKPFLENPWKVLNANRNGGSYLKALNYLLGNNLLYTDTTRSVFDRSDYYDVLVQLYNYFGEYKKAARAEEKFLMLINKINKIRADRLSDLSSSPIDGMVLMNAKEAILKVSEHKQVIMINEEHRNASHREMTLELLPGLYQQGFRYLAVETLSETDSLLNARKYPVTSTGYYTNDPVFGELIRRALQIGFTVTGYDYAGNRGLLQGVSRINPMARDNTRDSFAARTIINQILSSNPSAKILVHAGRAHAGKFNIKGIATMAYHFRQFTGIDPFSIDQVSMSGFSNPLDESPVYRYVMRKYDIDRPICFQNKKGNIWTQNPGYDMTIFTPRTTYNNGVAHWLSAGGKRKPVFVSYHKLGITLRNGIYTGAKPLTIQIFHKSESEQAVPTLSILLLPDEMPAKQQVLFKGSYIVKLKNEDNEVLKFYDLQVK